MSDAPGRLAENILYFARALRAAGIPLGPGSVLDALAAVRAAGVGAKEDFYWTLHAVFVKRHEHSVLFDQAFRIFFRKRGYLERLIAMMSPEMTGAPPQAEEPQASQRVLDALFAGRREDRAREAGDRARRPPHRVRPRGAGEEGLRADDRGRDRDRQGRHQAHGARLRRRQDPPSRAASARPSHRSAPHAARQHEVRRRHHRPEIPRAEDQNTADRGAARYLRLDEPVHQAVPAFPPRRHRRAEARLTPSCSARG